MNAQKKLDEFKKNGYNLKFIKKIQPKGGISFGERFIQKGDGYECCLHIYDFPLDVYQFWLEKVMNRENIICVVDVATKDKNVVLKNLKKSLREQRDRTIEEKNSIARMEAQQMYAELSQFANDINRFGEIVKSVSIRLYLYNGVKSELEKDVQKLRKELESIGFKAQVMLFEAKDEWSSIFLPYEEQVKLASNRHGHPIPSSTFGASYPFYYTSLQDPRGSYLGTTMTGGSVILDTFHVNEQRTFYNSICFGNMGRGKSTLLKMLEEDNYARGYFIRGFDKARDYYNLVQLQGGTVVALDGTEGKINPLEVFATTTKSEQDLTTDEIGSFTQHLSKLVTQFKFINPDATSIQQMEYESLLTRFYIEKGLWVEDPHLNLGNKKITGLPPEDYPTFSEFLAFLERILENEFKNEQSTSDRKRDLEVIFITIRSMVKEFGYIFDGITSIRNFDEEQIVFFDIDGISRFKKEIFHAQLFTGLTLIWNQALKNGRKNKQLYEKKLLALEDIKRFMVFIDECQNVINSSNLFAVDYIVSFQKEMRKFFAGIIFATQSPMEVIPEAADELVVSKLKQVFELTQYKFLFQLNPSVLPRMREVFGDSLTESEFSIIPDMIKGRCLLQISNKERIVFQVDPTPEQLERFRGGL